MRSLIAILRAKIVGPTLNKISHLKEDQVESLDLLLSDDPVVKIFSSRADANKNEAQDVNDKELSFLKDKVAVLSERIDVLERLLYKEK